MITLIIALCVFVQNVNSANILGVFTSSSASHIIIHKALADALIDAGHNVTIVSSTSLPGNQNFHHILIEENEDTRSAKDKYLSNLLQAKDVKTFMKNNFGAIAMSSKHQREAMFSKKLLKVLNNSSFDVVILGYFFNDFQLAIPAQLKVPVIVSWLAEPTNIVNGFVGNENAHSYVPNVMLPNENRIMEFRRRFVNFLVTGAFYGLDLFLNFQFGRYYKSVFLSLYFLPRN